MIRVCFLASLFLVSLTATWAQPADLAGKIRVSYRDGDPAPNYGVEYHYYKTSSQLVFLDSTERSLNNYTWNSGTGRLTDSTFGEHFDYTYTDTDSGTFVFSEGGTGEFVTYDASWDLDYDGTPDGEQIDAGNLPAYSHKIDMSSDTDGDGLSLAQEAIAGTNPQVRDTDGDGRDDDEEILVGTSPINKNFGPYQLDWVVDLSTQVTLVSGFNGIEFTVNPRNLDVLVKVKDWDGDWSGVQYRDILIYDKYGNLKHSSGKIEGEIWVRNAIAESVYLVNVTGYGAYLYSVTGQETYELIPFEDSENNTPDTLFNQSDSTFTGVSSVSRVLCTSINTQVYYYTVTSEIDIFTGEASYGINGENFLIRWSSDPSVQYQIQKSTDLSSWENIGMPVTGNGVEMQWAEPFEGDSVFYRLVLP